MFISKNVYPAPLPPVPAAPLASCPFTLPLGRLWQVTYEDDPGTSQCVRDYDSIATLPNGELRVDTCYTGPENFSKEI